MQTKREPKPNAGNWVTCCMVFSRLFSGILLACCLSATACSQTNTSDSQAILYVGTPCDSLIKSKLKISNNTVCEFIKWELKMYQEENDTGRFEITVLYGESQPNTNGFKRGRNIRKLKGNYFADKDNAESKNIYHLKYEELDGLNIFIL